ncbi:hypothetical protein [Actinosynnema sp. NPDC023587]|uniref:hypothetical protein n=1 Tax=Actinosynnema sp. NPDC023587 TaxID=3154695 RepID=UPI003404AABA
MPELGDLRHAEPHTGRNPLVCKENRCSSTVALRHRTRVLLGLAVPGLLVIVVLLGSWSIVSLGLVAVCAILTFLDWPTPALA